MKRVAMPGGGIAEFPDDMEDAEIEAALAGADTGAQPPPSDPTTTSSAASRFGGGVMEQSSVAQAAMHPVNTAAGLANSLVAAGGDPLKMIANGLLDQVIASGRRAGDEFSRLRTTDDPMTQAAGGVRTAVAALPVAGEFVAPMREAIPTDPQRGVDVARVAGSVTGTALDAATGYGVGKVAEALPGRLARAAEIAETKRVAQPALKAMQEDLGKVAAVNEKAGIAPKHLRRRGAKIEENYTPAQAAIDEGFDINAPAHAFREEALGRLEHYGNYKKIMLDRMGDVAKSSDLRAMSRSVKQQIGTLGRATSAGVRNRLRGISRELTDMANIAERRGGTISARDWNDKVISRLDAWIGDAGGQSMKTVRRQLIDLRHEANAKLAKNAELAGVNKRIANLSKLREALDDTVTKADAAGPAPVMPTTPPTDIPTALRNAGDIAGMVPGRTGATLRYGARGGARIAELLNELLGKGGRQ